MLSMDDTETLIICTKEELLAMHKRGEIEGEGFVITTEALFEVLAEYYGVNPHWQPNDVY
jgi:hypothetical protein